MATPGTRFATAISFGIVISAIVIYQIVVYYSNSDESTVWSWLSNATSFMPKLPSAVTHPFFLFVTIITLLFYDFLQKLQNISVLDLFTSHMGQDSLQHVGSYILVLVICVVCVSTWGFHPTNMHMDLSPTPNPDNHSLKSMPQDKISPVKKSYVAALFSNNEEGVDAYDPTPLTTQRKPTLSIQTKFPSQEIGEHKSNVPGPLKASSDEQKPSPSLKRMVSKLMMVPKSPSKANTVAPPSSSAPSTLKTPSRSPTSSNPPVPNLVTPTTTSNTVPQSALQNAAPNSTPNLMQLIAQSASRGAGEEGESSLGDSSERDDMSESNVSSYSHYTATSDITMSSPTPTLSSPSPPAPFQSVLSESVANPQVLVGWRVNVRGYGTGVVLSMRRKRFQTTRFVVQFETGSIVKLALQRSRTKGTVPFTLISKAN